MTLKAADPSCATCRHWDYIECGEGVCLHPSYNGRELTEKDDCCGEWHEKVKCRKCGSYDIVYRECVKCGGRWLTF